MANLVAVPIALAAYGCLAGARVAHNAIYTLTRSGFEARGACDAAR
jgi:hypothetical protein